VLEVADGGVVVRAELVWVVDVVEASALDNCELVVAGLNVLVVDVGFEEMAGEES
jgi:hypothetical protein